MQSQINFDIQLKIALLAPVLGQYWRKMIMLILSIIRWTGSNSNPNNNDGQGNAGTDRSNVVLLRENEWRRNYPPHLDSTTFLGLDKNSLHNLAVLDNSK